MAKTIVSLYDELSNAGNAVQDLVKAGIAREAISLVAKDMDGRYATYFEKQKNQEGELPPDDEEEGALVGGIIGGLAGMLLGLGVVALPGIGPIIAAGPLATMLLGAGAGTLTGSLVGAIVEWDVPKEEAEYYAKRVQQGGTLVSVRVSDDQVDQVTRLLNRHHPVGVR